jgi:8-oxo-dGTP pyrophosphatase MutT (NUDIX family)
MSKKVQKIIQATGALFLARSTQRYLFLLRDDDTHSNTWGLVGGRVENKEQIIECLHREIIEEIGKVDNIVKIIPLDLYTSQDEKFEYHTFACIVENEFIPKLNYEHKGYCWTTLDGIPKPIHPALYNSIQLTELKDKLKSLEEIIYQLS